MADSLPHIGPGEALSPAFIGDGLNEDPDEANAARYAARPYVEEFLSTREKISVERAFQLGAMASETAIRARLQFRADRAALAEAAKELPVLATFPDLEDFGRKHGYDHRLVARSWNCLTDERSRIRKSSTHPTTALILQLRETFRENGGRLDVRATEAILASMVKQPYRYGREAVDATIRSFGVGSISFMAHYVNHTLGLEGDDRLPLGSEQ